MAYKTQCLLISLFLLGISNVWSASGTVVSGLSSPVGVFGYQQIQKKNLSLFPQWLSVLERHLLDLKEAGDCQSTQFNRCHLRQWQAFLKAIDDLPVIEQIKRVNHYANEKEYILDIENYGMADYWATPKEFLINNGDCEDYAIIKMLSMKWLGYDVDAMRVVVVQDTNLRVAHAVMAIENKNDILILDNQIDEVISHADIFHYVPVYSVNEHSWWMHVPN
ncbi:MAG: transglutaminase-like cysteine peptidase [Proteobacteria bacterium]|nr:transglutaminase-like cysteine peptidase [Pseudomonadota bacterium]